MGKFPILHSSFSWSWFFLGSAFGFLLLTGAVALFVYAWGKAQASTTVKGVRDAAVLWAYVIGPMGLGGLFLVYFSLFRRRVIMVDREKGTLIDSKRALFTHRKEASYRFTEIAFVGHERFSKRNWMDGALESESPKANVWLQMLDGRTYSFGLGEPEEARSLAQGLSGLMKVPLKEYDPMLCPTQDRWTTTQGDD